METMRPPVLLLVVLLTFTVGRSTTVAQVRRITTDKAPSFLWADDARGEIHVYTAGVDRNFNHLLELDSGDIAPRWFVIDGATEVVVDSVTFNGFFNDFPLRPAVDPVGRRLFVPQSDRIRAFDLDTRTLLHDTVIDVPASAVTFDTLTNRLLFSIRPGFVEPGIVGCIDGTSFRPLYSTMSGINPSMTGIKFNRRDSTAHYYTVCEGTGEANATLSFSSLDRDIFGSANDLHLKEGAVALLTTPSSVIVALNDDASVHVLDPATHIELPFSPVSTGLHRPHSLAIDPFGNLIVGTDDGTLLFIDTTTGMIVDSMNVGGQVEAIAVGSDSTAYVALAAGRDSVVVAIDVVGRAEVDELPIRGVPVALLVDTIGDLHVFTNSTDSTVWSKHDPVTLIESDRRSFPGTLYRPARVAYDPTANEVVLPFNDAVIAFNNTDAQSPPRIVYAERVNGGHVAGVTLAEDYFLVTELSTDSAAQSGFVHVIDHQGDYRSVFATGPRPIAAAGTVTKPERAHSFYALDRGARDAKRSHLTLFQSAPSIFTDSDTLGRSANHIIIVDDAGVTMNGSHDVVAVDLTEWRVNGRFQLGTDGFNGPRESILIEDDTMVTSTYNGDIRVSSPQGGYRVFPTSGKAEGLAYLPSLSKLFVAIPFAADYSADSVVVVFTNTDLVASVERISPLATALELDQSIPNPATDHASITFSIERPGNVLLDLHALDGRQIARLIDRSLDRGSFTVEVRTSELMPGTYVYTLRTPQGVESRTMTIVK